MTRIQLGFTTYTSQYIHQLNISNLIIKIFPLHSRFETQIILMYNPNYRFEFTISIVHILHYSPISTDIPQILIQLAFNNTHDHTTTTTHIQATKQSSRAGLALTLRSSRSLPKQKLEPNRPQVDSFQLSPIDSPKGIFQLETYQFTLTY